MDFNFYTLERKMLLYLILLLGGLMFLSSCLTRDLPQKFGGENSAPFIDIDSVSLDPEHGIYSFEEEIEENPTITLDVIDVNDKFLTGGWYIKDINNPNNVDPKKRVEKEIENNKASFSYTIEKRSLTCGINQIKFIVSDRGLRYEGVWENGKPYPGDSQTIEDKENVKIDVQTWLIEKRCN